MADSVENARKSTGENSVSARGDEKSEAESLSQK
jgi:hypothetical protein